MAIRLNKTEICQEDYEPPYDTRRRFWRHTKKQPISCGTIYAPGLLDYNDTKLPLKWFFVAVTFEILGLVFLNRVGMYWYFAMFLGLIDLVLATGLHVPSGKIQELKILHFIAQAGNSHDLPAAAPPDWINVLKNKINLLRLPRGGFIFLILGIGVFKALSYYAFVGELNPQVLIISGTFLVVAIIHIWWTGYFMFWLFTEVSDWLQHNKYVNAVEHREMHPDSIHYVPFEVANLGTHVFEVSSGELEWRVIDRHVIISYDLLDLLRGKLQVYVRPWTCSGDLYSILTDICPMNGPRDDTLPQKPGTGPYKYVLLTWGILTDEQVKRLSETPLPHKCEGIIIEAIIHQAVNIMGIQLPWELGDNAALAGDTGE